MQQITLKLTIDEANLILEGLGEMPFKRVFALVGKIRQQASAQLGSNGRVAEDIEMSAMGEIKAKQDD